SFTEMISVKEAQEFNPLIDEKYFIGALWRADEILLIDERVELLRFLHGDHLGFHAEIAGARADELETVELALSRGEHQAAVGMQRARLTGERLDLAIQVDGVLLQARDVRFAVERVHAAGRVPRRAGRQLALFDEERIRPADLGEVIQH